MTSIVPFRLFQHLPLVEVTLDGFRQETFIFDTGIGLTVVSDSVLRELGHSPSGKMHVGHRMTGQEIAAPLSELNQLSLGGHSQARPVVGSFDLSRFPLEKEIPGGFLSLTFFERTAATLDFTTQELTLVDSGSLMDPDSWGTPVSAIVKREGPETEVFLELQLPNGRRVKAEVDTGSDTLFLNSKFMDELGVSAGGPGVLESRGTDDFGRPFVQYRTQLTGPVCVAANSSFAQQSPKVIFADLIYDAVVGFDFLRTFRVTFDIAGSTLSFAGAAGARHG